MADKKELWEEFIVEVVVDIPPKGGQAHTCYSVCGLCGNTGVVVTQPLTPAGHRAKYRGPCICPNGRSLKNRNKDG